MPRKRSMVRQAALITGIFSVLAALIGAFALIIRQDRSPSVIAHSGSNSSPTIAIGGDVKESQIIVKSSSPQQEGTADVDITLYKETSENQKYPELT